MNTESIEQVQHLEIRFRRKRIVLRWHSDDIDYVAQKYGRAIDYSNTKRTVQIKFSADASLRSIVSKKPDFSLILNMVNFLEDIGYSKHRIPRKLYDKVFFACNLPSIRQDGGLYRPALSALERSQLEKYIVRNCEFLFKNAIQYKN